MLNTESLTKLFFDYLKSKNSKLYKNLNDGLPLNNISQLEQKSELQLPEEIIQLYSYKNGLNNNNLSLLQSLMFENGLFMPLQQCVEEYNVLKKETNMLYKFPLFDSGLGEFLLIDCDNESPTFKRILIWSPPMLILEPVVIYDSLPQLILTVMRCFIVKAYQYNKQRELESDLEHIGQETKRLNPHSMFWK